MENRREVVFVRQEEMNVLEDEEDSNAQGDIEELEKLLGHEVGGDEEDQAEENALMSMQQEEIFEVDKNTKEKRVFYIDECDEILEEEWRNSRANKDEEEMLLGDDKFDPDADLKELEQLLGYINEEVKEANLEGSAREKLIKDIKQVDPPNFYHKTLVEEKDPQEEIGMMLPKEDKDREVIEEGMVKEKPNEGTPNKIPPKPPEYPFLLIPKEEHTRRKRTHDEHVAKTKWEQLKKGKVGSKMRKPRAKGGYEQRRDKWKEDINNHGAKGKRNEGVKASPDATVPT